MQWFVDGNNVMGSRPDGWWNNPGAAKARLAQAVARWCASHNEPVLLVFDQPRSADAQQASEGNLVVEFAPRRGRDAADHHIVDRVESAYVDQPNLTVVTADRGLIDALPPGVAVVGPGRFRTLIGRG